MLRHLALTSAAGVLLAAGTLAGSGAFAAFNADSGTGASTWSTGALALGATPASAVFTLSGLTPGSFGKSCVVVNYSGTVDADVKLYVASSSGALAGYLTWQVEEGSGSSPSCSDFTANAVDYNTNDATTGTLASFASTATSYSTGVGSWAPSSSSSEDYEFNWQLQDNNAAESTSASLTLTWEAQNA